MAEVENIVEINVAAEPEKLPLGKRIVGGIKEWCRKNIVKLKRRPMNIAFVVLIVSTIVNLCMLGNFSQLGLNDAFNGEMQPLCIFINQLFCILVLLLFMNSFPKRAKKPAIVMLVMCFVFMAVLFSLDIYMYVSWKSDYSTYIELLKNSENSETSIARLNAYYNPSVNGVLAHAILVAIAAVLTATYPLYGKLICKINTRKIIESTDLKEEIDTSE